MCRLWLTIARSCSLEEPCEFAPLKWWESSWFGGWLDFKWSEENIIGFFTVSKSQIITRNSPKHVKQNLFEELLEYVAADALTRPPHGFGCRESSDDSSRGTSHPTGNFLRSSRGRGNFEGGSREGYKGSGYPKICWGDGIQGSLFFGHANMFQLLLNSKIFCARSHDLWTGTAREYRFTSVQ